MLGLLVCAWAAARPTGAEGVPLYESPLYAFAEQVHGALPKGGKPVHDNRIAIIDNGYDALLLRVHLIRHARRSIDIQTFILENDECGRYLMYELIHAARRGVRVRLLADHFMSSRDPEWVAFLATADPNFEIRYYRPAAKAIRPSSFRVALNMVLYFKKTNQRMHNKLMVFDDLIAMTGGRNIDNHYYNHSTSYNFLDREAMLVGPLLPEMKESFNQYWNFPRAIPGHDLRDVHRRIVRGDYRARHAREDFEFNGFFDEIDGLESDDALIATRFVEPFRSAAHVEFLCDFAGKNRTVGLWGGGKFTRVIRHQIRETKRELIIESPYLILNTSARNAFRKVRRNNPEARVLVATNSFASTDNTVAYAANYKLRSTYIESLGFEIHEMKPRPPDLLEFLPNYPDLERRAAEAGQGRKPFLAIHAKSFVRDGRISYIGSYNFHPRSDNLDTECGLLIDDEAFARDLAARILAVSHPDRSWVIARTEMPLSELNFLIEGLSGLTPLDLWPLRNTSSFELKPDKEPVPPDHQDFYENYTDAGGFPGAEGVTTKEVTTYLYKILGTLAIPIL